MATPKTERLCEIILRGSSLSCWRKASRPRIMERAENRTQWTDEVNSSLLVSILTAQGRRTLPATLKHRGCTPWQREERGNKQGLQETCFVVLRGHGAPRRLSLAYLSISSWQRTEAHYPGRRRNYAWFPQWGAEWEWVDRPPEAPSVSDVTATHNMNLNCRPYKLKLFSIFWL